MDKKSCSLGNSYMKAQGTSPPPGVNLFQMGKGDYLWATEKERERGALRFFPIITVTFFKNVE